MQLRLYQANAIERASAEIEAGKRRVLIAAPTGAGKTVIAVAGLIAPSVANGHRVLFLAHREELITQCAAKVRECGMPVGIIKAGFTPDMSAPVQVASVQTLNRRTKPPADLVIVDEAHHVTADSYQNIIMAYRQAFIVGLSATPYRADGQGLAGIFDSLVVVASIRELIDAGFLVRPRTFALPPPDLAGVHTVAGDFNSGELATVMNTDRIGTALVETWKSKAAGRTTIAFAVNVAHSQHIAAQFLAAGIPAEHIDGTMSSEDRAAILARLASGETLLVSNCSILTEGYDLPRCSCIILARPTKSRALWRQMIGRGLRSAPDKIDCQIHDHAGCHQQHGGVTDEEELTLESVKPKPAATRTCTNCYAVMPSGTAVCPECQFTFPVSTRAEPTNRNGVHRELVEVTEGSRSTDAQGFTKPEREFLHMMISVAAKHGWKPGAVGHRFKEKFGRWPAKAKTIAALVNEATQNLKPIDAPRPVTFSQLEDQWQLA